MQFCVGCTTPHVVAVFNAGLLEGVNTELPDIDDLKNIAIVSYDKGFSGTK